MFQTILTPEEMAFSPSASATETKMLFLLTVVKWVSAKRAEQTAAQDIGLYDGKDSDAAFKTRTQRRARSVRNRLKLEAV